MTYSAEKCLNDDTINEIVALVRQERHVFPFLATPVFEEAVRRSEVFVVKNAAGTVGLVRYHHRKDSITTLHEIVVNKQHRGQGLGKLLIERLVAESSSYNQKVIRLKCPLDLPANGFYARLGFSRVAIDSDRPRTLAVWERSVGAGSVRVDHVASVARPFAAFFVTLTNDANSIGDIVRHWEESGDARNPFAHVIFTPLFSSPTTVAFIQGLKKLRGSVVMFDSGGYQVQMGKVRYEELFDRLRRFYLENEWADWYVLPDHVPRSADSDREVDFKVRETLDFARLFLRMMPQAFIQKAIGVVHGRTEEQVRRCVAAYVAMGVRYLGFGSFGTSGPNGTVNAVSRQNLRLLRLVQALSQDYALQLHVFGIGSPSHLIRLANAGISPTSFDSSGWWKAGGFGKVFFPGGRQLHITLVNGHNATLRGIEREKSRAQHQCAFCNDLVQLRQRRMLRVMHNLAAMLDTAEGAI